ncbi:MAG: HNH endonuclease [Gemmatimonadota bacterium]|nr:HNH endonuclease [Gemmatimonadota bacterium]
MTRKKSSSRRKSSGRSAAQGKPPARSGGSRRRSRRGRGGAHAHQPRDTSLPTSRTAYVETRRWLLERHGSVCAYCRRPVDPDLITLDHATPRRGKTAYDRRDNLLLCCPECNAKKRDQSFLAFLLHHRERAANVLRYGQHLSPMLLHMAKEIAGPDAAARAERLADPDYPYAD